MRTLTSRSCRPLVVALGLLGVLHCDALNLRSQPRRHVIELRATGTVPQALVQRILPSGTAIDQTALPWQMTAAASDRDLVSLRVGIPPGMVGAVRCEILVDGVLWRSLDANGNGPDAQCMGTIGSQ